MSLNKKDFEIITYISEKDSTLKELATIFNTSERNIRYCIDNINFYLSDFSLEKIKITNGTVSLNILEEKLENFFTLFCRNQYIFSKEEREEYISISLLFKQNISVEELSEYFQISGATLSKDLKNIDSFLSKFQLYIIKDNGVLKIVGNEKKLRHLKMIFALKYLYLKENKISYIKQLFFFSRDIIDILLDYLSKQDVKKSIFIVQLIEKELNLHFEKEFKNIILIYLIVTFERINSGHIIDKKNNENFLRTTNYYKIIQEKVFVGDLSYQYEALHLAEYFLSGYNSENFYENRFLIDNFVFKLLKIIEEEKDILLLQNRDLIEEIVEYLVTAIYRIKNNFTLKNEISLNEREEEILNIIIENLHKLEKYLIEPLRNEEISIISQIIYKHIEKNKKLKLQLSVILKVISQNSVDANLDNISNNLLAIYPTLVDDDRVKTHTLSLLDILTEKDIIFNETNDIKEFILPGVINLTNNNLNYSNSIEDIYNIILAKNFDYIPKKNIVICYCKESLTKEVGISITFSKSGIYFTNNVLVKTFILISNINKSKHLQIINNLESIIEENLIDKLLTLNSQKLILEKIDSFFIEKRKDTNGF